MATGKIIQADNIDGLKTFKNFIPNGLATLNTSGWTTYADAAGTRPVDGTGGSANITWTTTTTDPLTGAKSFLITKDASNRQGEGLSTDFTIDLAQKSKMLKVEFDYIVNSGTFTAGSSTTDSDMIVYLYDVTNNRLIEPSTFKLYTSSTTLPDKYQGYFQTSPDSTSYRLIFHVATTSASAWALKVDNVAVSPSEYVAGTIITDWQSYTPVVTNLGAGSYTSSGRWRRVGDSIEVTYRYTKDGTNGTGTSVVYVSPPSGITLDLSFTASGAVVSGEAYTSLTSVDLISLVDATAGFYLFNSSSKSSVNGATATASADFRASVTAKVQGWSAGAQMSDGYDGRVVAAVLQVATSTAVTGDTTNIPFSSAYLDTVAGFNGTTGYVVQSAGNYKLSGTMVGAAITAFKAYVDGAFHSIIGSVQTNGSRGSIGGTLYNLKAGQVITIRSSTTTTITAAPGDNLSIEKLSGSAFMSPTETVAFFARDTAGDVIGTSMSLIKFTSIQNSTHGAYSTTTGLFTAESSGYYSASFMVATANVTLSTSQRFQAILYKGASIYAYGSRENGVGVSQFYSSNGSVESVYLNAGETLSVYAISNVATTASTVDEASHFSVVKVK